MNTIFHAFYNGDCYEVTVRDFNLVKIVKHTSGSGLMREVEFDHLHANIQEAIIEAFSEQIMHNKDQS